VVDWRKAVEHIRSLSSEYGPRVPVWRYDPIVHTSLTPAEWHVANFSELASQLEGAADEVVVSFAQVYRKTQRHMDEVACRLGLRWYDPDDCAKRALVTSLACVAKRHGMRLSMCAQLAYVVPGVDQAHCVDADRLSDVLGRPIRAKLKGNRADCGCFESRDIGAYGTCPHGCVYCYAVDDPGAAREAFRTHDPDAEMLAAPQATPMGDAGTLASRQPTLFGPDSHESGRGQG
jgi:hypothetical protein